jgi:ketosteroid isomerase-like protein
MMPADENREAVWAVLESWAKATRENRQNDILKNHLPKLVIFDVLAPMKYDSAEAYRKSWGDWQPDTPGEGIFQLENLVVDADAELATAHCFVRCGGTLADGRTFEDVIRATFCLRKQDETWRVFHRHISKPLPKMGE